MFNTASNIIALADTYAAHGRYSETYVSRLAVGSWDAIARLREGNGITTHRADKLVQWFSDNWPSTADWPEGIGRPEPQVKTGAPEEDAA